MSSRAPVPASAPGRLERLRRRTAILRWGTATALVALLAAAFLVARAEDVRQTPLVPSGTTGLLVLDISASTGGAPFRQTIDELVATGERVGVVAFSDAAYELLPLGSPSRELVPLLRYFDVSEDGKEPPAQNPWLDFRAGTRISEGLRTAREIFVREGVRRGSVLLLSDFEITYDEIGRVAEQVALLRLDDVQVRLVPFDPTPERRARMNAILGSAAIVEETEAGTRVRAPETGSLGALAPWAFVGVSVLLVAMVALNEALLPRLEVRA